MHMKFFFLMLMAVTGACKSPIIMYELPDSDGSFEKVRYHPFGDDSSSIPAGDAEEVEQITVAAVASRNQAFSLRTLAPSPNSIGLRFEVLYGGTPVCGHTFKSFMLPGGVFVTGTLPDLAPAANRPVSRHLVWPGENEVKTALTSFVAAPTAPYFQPFKRCLWADAGGALQAAWEVEFRSQGEAYYAIAGRQLFAFEKRVFSATGVAVVFDTNPKEGRLARIPLSDLTGDRRLESPAFATDTAKVAKAESGTLEFDFLPSDPRFQEVSAFTHASLMLEFFKGLGLQPPPQITVHLHSPDYEANRTLYHPPTAPTDRPEIFIGDGDGINLNNLASDSDVIAHELGHHVVYRFVKSSTGESQVIHEALADFFAMARRGNPCLAPSVCVAEGTLCLAGGQCLRSAANSLNFHDPSLPSEPHLRSQLLSGLLWDLRTSFGIALTDLIRLVYDAIEYLPPKAGYDDLLFALLAADQAKFSGVRRCNIIDAAKGRGLESFLNGTVCNVSDRVAASDDDAIDTSLPPGLEDTQKRSPPGRDTHRTFQPKPPVPHIACGVMLGGDPRLLAIMLLFALVPILRVR